MAVSHSSHSFACQPRVGQSVWDSLSWKSRSPRAKSVLSKALPYTNATKRAVAHPVKVNVLMVNVVASVTVFWCSSTDGEHWETIHCRPSCCCWPRMTTEKGAIMNGQWGMSEWIDSKWLAWLCHLVHPSSTLARNGPARAVISFTACLPVSHHYRLTLSRECSLQIANRTQWDITVRPFLGPSSIFLRQWGLVVVVVASIVPWQYVCVGDPCLSADQHCTLLT